MKRIEHLLLLAALAALALAVAPARAMDTHGLVQLWEGGPYWAETNVGADEPWDDGLYFWWGDTVGYRRENEAWVASDGSTSNFSFGRGNTPTYGKDNATLRSEGWITGEGVLAPAHDAARAHWGGSWRMPTYQELDDLCHTCCDWTWTTTNGASGYVVRGRGHYSATSIFVPAAGYGDGTYLNLPDWYGGYSSSVPDESLSNYARGLFFHERDNVAKVDYRFYGLSVRPVLVPPPAPAFAEGGEAVTTRFERCAGDTWALTAFAELGNDALGKDLADEQIKVYRGDTADGVTNAVVPTITGKKSAIKVEMTVDAPSSAPAQFFRVGFGE